MSSNFRATQDRGFADLFSNVAQGFSNYEATTAVPRLVASAHGTVLELGPAVGSQLLRLDPARLSHVYGVEPNGYFLAPLEDMVKKLDLGSMYTPIIGRVEDEEHLRKHGITPESMDCVLSIQVLCSVPDPAAVAKVLYRVLKPGGQLILWEHQASRDNMTRWVQALYNLVWTPTIGGCRLNNEVEVALLAAGHWKHVELERDEVPPWLLMPRVWGRLTKADSE